VQIAGLLWSQCENQCPIWEWICYSRSRVIIMATELVSNEYDVEWRVRTKLMRCLTFHWSTLSPTTGPEGSSDLWSKDCAWMDDGRRILYETEGLSVELFHLSPNNVMNPWTPTEELAGARMHPCSYVIQNTFFLVALTCSFVGALKSLAACAFEDNVGEKRGNAWRRAILDLAPKMTLMECTLRECSYAFNVRWSAWTR